MWKLYMNRFYCAHWYIYIGLMILWPGMSVPIAKARHSTFTLNGQPLNADDVDGSVLQDGTGTCVTCHRILSAQIRLCKGTPPG